MAPLDEITSEQRSPGPSRMSVAEKLVVEVTVKNMKTLPKTDDQL